MGELDRQRKSLDGADNEKDRGVAKRCLDIRWGGIKRVEVDRKGPKNKK